MYRRINYGSFSTGQGERVRTQRGQASILSHASISHVWKINASSSKSYHGEEYMIERGKGPSPSNRHKKTSKTEKTRLIGIFDSRKHKTCNIRSMDRGCTSSPFIASTHVGYINAVGYRVRGKSQKRYCTGCPLSWPLVCISSSSSLSSTCVSVRFP